MIKMCMEIKSTYEYTSSSLSYTRNRKRGYRRASKKTVVRGLTVGRPEGDRLTGTAPRPPPHLLAGRVH